MATATALHLSRLKAPALQPPNPYRRLAPASAVPISNAQTRERQKMKDLFREARERCISDPTGGVPFSVDDFHRALDERAFGSDLVMKVKGTVIMTNTDGAFVDILSTSSAFLPVEEACIYKISHVSEAGIYPGFQDEFVVIGENSADDSLILSLRSIQYDLAWERCQELLANDAVVTGKVIGGNNGGVVILVEGLNGFAPFSHIAEKSTAEALIGKELRLKFVTVDKKESLLVLSNRWAVIDTLVNLEIGSVVTGTVRSLKPYGALVDVGGAKGLLHVSQISHDRVPDISAILQPGDTLKVMILSHDHEREQVSLSTKKLEPTPGDMIRNPKLVFEKADEMAEDYKQRLAEILKSHLEISRANEEATQNERFKL